MRRRCYVSMGMMAMLAASCCDMRIVGCARILESRGLTDVLVVVVVVVVMVMVMVVVVVMLASR